MAGRVVGEVGWIEEGWIRGALTLLDRCSVGGTPKVTPVHSNVQLLHCIVSTVERTGREGLVSFRHQEEIRK